MFDGMCWYDLGDEQSDNGVRSPLFSDGVSHTGGVSVSSDNDAHVLLDATLRKSRLALTSPVRLTLSSAHSSSLSSDSAMVDMSELADIMESLVADLPPPREVMPCRLPLENTLAELLRF